MRHSRRQPIIEHLPDFPSLYRREWASDSLRHRKHLTPITHLRDIAHGERLSATSPTSRPTWRTDDPLGLGALLFDGVDDWMQSEQSALVGDAGFTLFLVFASLTRAIPRGPFSIRTRSVTDLDNLNDIELFWIVGDRIIAAANRPGPSWWDCTHVDLDTPDPMVMSIRFDGGLAVGDGPVRVNGVNVTSTKTGADFSPNDRLEVIKLGRGITTGQFHGWVWNATVYTNGGMSTAQVAEVEASLAARYGVY